MKKNKLIVALTLIAIIASFAMYGYREYYRKPSALDSMTADLTLQADKLLEDYQANEAEANKKYLGKVLEVKGFIASLSNEQDTAVNILFGNKDAMAHVSCSMSAMSIPDVKALKPGTRCIIRGICTGYLMDVELNRCVLVK